MRLSGQHVAVLALFVAAVTLLAGWQVIRSSPTSQPVELSTSRVESTQAGPASPDAAGVSPVSSPSGGAPAPPTAGSGLLVVDVTGKVRHPGIVELPPGSRVVDALKAAGGARAGANTSTINLARPLVDGEQIVVGLDVPVSGLPDPDAAVPGSRTDSDPVQVNINTASAAELETLPGVGPVTAAAIIAWRTEHGGFASVDELLEVSGIGDATLSELEAYVHV